MTATTDPDRLEQLEQRLRALEDERAIARLIASYGPLVDSGDAEAVAALDAMDVPNGPVLALDEVFADPHVRARGMVGEFAHPVLGAFPALRVPLRFEGWDQPELGRPPLLGEHTDTVLQEKLGYDAARIAALRETGAI